MTCSMGCGRPAQVRGMCRSHYSAHRKRQDKLGQWTPRQASIGTSRRLRALIAMGYSQAHLAQLLDTHQSWVSKLVYNPRQRVNADTATKVVALYDRISMTPGPSDRARSSARRRRWAPPLAWDDDTIDDPNASPCLGIRRPVPFPERYTELRELGYTDLPIAAKLGIRPESLMRQLLRYGLPPSPELASIAARDKYARSAS